MGRLFRIALDRKPREEEKGKAVGLRAAAGGSGSSVKEQQGAARVRCRCPSARGGALRAGERYSPSGRRVSRWPPVASSTLLRWRPAGGRSRGDSGADGRRAPQR